MFFDRGNHYEFLSLGQELAAPGDLQHPQTFDFEFKNVEKQYESYNGINVKLRYFVRVTVSRRMQDVVREKDIWVYSYRMPPESNSSIKMDVGIEDCLHIEFEYSKSKYHLKDVIVGRIYFLLVRLKIKHMELSIIRRETTGTAPNQYNESETLVRFEVSLVLQLHYSVSHLEVSNIFSRLWMDLPLEVYPVTYTSCSSLPPLTQQWYFRRNYSNPSLPWRF
ncbi:Vacuolar protein sorting-associated protein 26 [Maublancomyces gigas]|uniref:Vacuolar protein sorting-associated protein 26 n=1 Tax=Discina gigas TaxID=1032678 RepID=A0ABR3GNH7_9PEZI